MLNDQFPYLTQVLEIELQYLSITDNSILSFLQISPNPTTNEALLSFNILENNYVTIEIFDILGNVIFNNGNFFSEGENLFPLDVKNYANGRYGCRLVVNGEQIGVVNFVVSK